MKQIQALYNLEWDDIDRNYLPSEYTNEPVHIALERADMNKHKKYYKYIFSKSPKVLQWHINGTSSVLTWNFSKN
jgi:hypothetical protein